MGGITAAQSANIGNSIELRADGNILIIGDIDLSDTSADLFLTADAVFGAGPGDGNGAIVVSALSDVITMGGGGLFLEAGDGIGTLALPVDVVDLGDVAGVTSTGSIFLLNDGTRDINITSVFLGISGLTASAGVVDLQNFGEGVNILTPVLAGDDVRIQSFRAGPIPGHTCSSFLYCI